MGFDLFVDVAHSSIRQVGNVWNGYRGFVNLTWASDPANAFVVLLGKRYSAFLIGLGQLALIQQQKYLLPYAYPNRYY